MVCGASMEGARPLQQPGNRVLSCLRRVARSGTAELRPGQQRCAVILTTQCHLRPDLPESLLQMTEAD
ncbi:hypothetical protein D9M68_339250 [compost metagenome]